MSIFMELVKGGGMVELQIEWKRDVPIRSLSMWCYRHSYFPCVSPMWHDIEYAKPNQLYGITHMFSHGGMYGVTQLVVRSYSDEFWSFFCRSKTNVPWLLILKKKLQTYILLSITALVVLTLYFFCNAIFEFLVKLFRPKIVSKSSKFVVENN